MAGEKIVVKKTFLEVEEDVTPQGPAAPSCNVERKPAHDGSASGLPATYNSEPWL